MKDRFLMHKSRCRQFSHSYGGIAILKSPAFALRYGAADAVASRSAGRRLPDIVA
ncbi:MAG: hypothetical protein HOP33_15330 [Verrucomicrobia bacterium]|nr:hypothetical protein [Verrucomicrobiota bacterium]